MSKHGHRNGSDVLDPLIHEAARLQIVAVLNECESADFNFVLGTTRLTRGNLSTHMARLLAAGYVIERESHVGRAPRTSYCLSKAGRLAYSRYTEDWNRLTRRRIQH